MSATTLASVNERTPSDQLRQQKNAARRKRSATKRLWSAMWAGNVEAMGKALADGADCKGKGKFDDEMWWEAPILWAACFGKTEACVLLARSGADVSVRSETGATPLHYTVYRGHFECARALLKLGAQVEAQDMWGQKPIHRAAAVSAACVKELASFGAQLNDAGAEHGSPLHYAVDFGNVESCCALFELGANAEIKNAKGDTPMMVALNPMKSHGDSEKRLRCAAALSALMEPKEMREGLPEAQEARRVKRAL